MSRNDEARMTDAEGMTKSENPRNRFDEQFWNDHAAPVVREGTGEKRIYDLEERTALFGEAVIDFAKTIPRDAGAADRLIGQLVGAATSVGANYVEADDAVSKKEFVKNIGTSRKEARETKHFLRMVVRAVPGLKTRSSQALARGARITSVLLEDLEKQVMNFVIRASTLFSSFVIRHSSF